MITFKVNGEIEVSVPTSIDEITKNYLIDVAKEINVGNYYTLIGLITVTKLEDIAFTCVNSKIKNGSTVAVVPISIKHGFSEDEFINNIETGDKLLISRTAIEMSDHVRLSNNLISPATIAGYLAADDNLRKAIMNKTFFGDIKCTPKIYLIEFKVVPNSEIHGSYTKNSLINNPFVKSIK